MSSLERLNASINALAEELFPIPYTGELGPLCDAAVAEIKRLKEQSANRLVGLCKAGDDNDQLRQQLSKETERLDFLDKTGGRCIQGCGKIWYWRKDHGMPHNKAENLRAAIDRAMEPK